MPVIGHIVNICMYVAGLAQLSDAIDRSDHTYLHVFYKSRAIIRCLWLGRSMICGCILQVLSRDPMPLIGQIIDRCLDFANLAQLLDAIDRSVHTYVLGFCKYWVIIAAIDLSMICACSLWVLSNFLMPLTGPTTGICLYSTSLEQLSDAIHRSDH